MSVKTIDPVRLWPGLPAWPTGLLKMSGMPYLPGLPGTAISPTTRLPSLVNMESDLEDEEEEEDLVVDNDDEEEEPSSSHDLRIQEKRSL